VRSASKLFWLHPIDCRHPHRGPASELRLLPNPEAIGQPELRGDHERPGADDHSGSRMNHWPEVTARITAAAAAKVHLDLLHRSARIIGARLRSSTSARSTSARFLLITHARPLCPLPIVVTYGGDGIDSQDRFLLYFWSPECDNMSGYRSTRQIRGRRPEARRRTETRPLAPRLSGSIGYASWICRVRPQEPGGLDQGPGRMRAL